MLDAIRLLWFGARLNTIQVNSLEKSLIFQKSPGHWEPFPFVLVRQSDSLSKTRTSFLAVASPGRRQLVLRVTIWIDRFGNDRQQIEANT